MDYSSNQTEWNADDDKLRLILAIEASLEEAFINYSYEDIYIYSRAYKREVVAKFSGKDNETVLKNINELMKKLTEKYKRLLETKTDIAKNDFYVTAEELFEYISSQLKKAGVYFREKRGATTAVMQR